jgi:hypothetical protein
MCYDDRMPIARSSIALLVLCLMFFARCNGEGCDTTGCAPSADDCDSPGCGGEECVPDSGSGGKRDAGTRSDGGSRDGGGADAGPADGGSAGGSSDGGSSDAGQPGSDAGWIYKHDCQGCPLGYHIVGYFCSNFDGGACPTVPKCNNAAICAPNTASFDQCGDGCPSPYVRTRVWCESGCIPYGNSVTCSPSSGLTNAAHCTQP